VLSPEDVLIHKVLMGRGAEQGKHDLSDAAGIVRRQQLDLDYLRERLKAMGAPETASAALVEMGVAV
jgi:hypothetical protein